MIIQILRQEKLNFVNYENMELLLLALHKVFPGDFPLRTYELVANCVCNDTSYECTSNNCDICKDLKLFYEFLEARNWDTLIQYYQWQPVEYSLKKKPDDKIYKKLAKVMKEEDVSSVVLNLKSQLPKLLHHV